MFGVRIILCQQHLLIMLAATFIKYTGGIFYNTFNYTD